MLTNHSASPALRSFYTCDECVLYPISCQITRMFDQMIKVHHLTSSEQSASWIMRLICVCVTQFQVDPGGQSSQEYTPLARRMQLSFRRATSSVRVSEELIFFVTYDLSLDTSESHSRLSLFLIRNRPYRFFLHTHPIVTATVILTFSAKQYS